MSASLSQPRPQEKPTQYTSYFAEWLRAQCASCDHNYVKTLPQQGMQFRQCGPQAPFDSIANYGDANLLAGHDSVAVAHKPVGTNAYRHDRMARDCPKTPNAGEVGWPAQPKG